MTIQQRDDEYIGTALAALDELRSRMAAWERRLVDNVTHYGESASRIDAGSPTYAALKIVSARAEARLDVVRDVLSIIGR